MWEDGRHERRGRVLAREMGEGTPEFEGNSRRRPATILPAIPGTPLRRARRAPDPLYREVNADGAARVNSAMVQSRPAGMTSDLETR